MRKYRCENWTMKEIAQAMKGTDSQGRNIVIPLFQRGKRWSPEKREKFINSLLLGYPVGTLLFADKGDKKYSVIDGLQRSTTICEYILYPTKIVNLKNVDENILDKIREALFPYSSNITINSKINSIILSYISTQPDFDSVEVFNIANDIIKEMGSMREYQQLINELVSILTVWFRKYKQDFETILNSEMPIIIYSNNSDNLHEIFERINKQGEPLTPYEIFAASWRQDKYRINNIEIINYILKKYDSLVLEQYELENYNRNEVLRSQQLTAFEYLFGLGKYLINQYDFLNLEPNKKDNEITTIGFELIDVCLNKSKKISELAEIFYNANIDINKLERRIKESINFVYSAIAPICDFKGNKRQKERYLHPKYFILALIAFVFNEMYDLNDLDNKKDNWGKIKDVIYSRIQHHYVFGLVNNDWHDGGIGKMYTAVKDRTFAEEISKKSWDALLDGYFSQSLMAKEAKKVANPTKADIVLLNCIYVNIFTVNDQLSNAKFDIEHLATKERMKALIKQSNCQGLPISSIGNLCYLPENINRQKKAKTIYEENEEKGFNLSINEIEEKFSFTVKDSFEFLNLPYESGDAIVLEEEYIKFLEKRFKIQKNKIYRFLNI